MILRMLGPLAAFALGLLGFPVFSPAQTPPKIPRLGYVIGLTSTEGRHFLEAARQGLREMGYVEGNTYCPGGPLGGGPVRADARASG